MEKADEAMGVNALNRPEGLILFIFVRFIIDIPADTSSEIFDDTKFEKGIKSHMTQKLT